MPRTSRSLPLSLPAALLLASAACAGTAEPTSQPPAIAVSVAPGQVDLPPDGTIQFTATVTGAANPAVEWSVQEALGGSVDASGAYRAPSVTGTFHVVATSREDRSRSGSATVTVTATPAPSLTVLPATATVGAGAGPTTFTATLANATGTVSWSLSPAVGSLSATAGTSVSYTPPATLGAQAAVTLTASAAGVSAAASITVTPSPAPSLTVLPATATVGAGAGPTAFTATLANATGAISWSLSPAVGSLSATAGTSVSYTPPATLGARTAVTLTASAAGVSSSAAITVTPSPAPSLTVLPATATVAAGSGPTTFTATLANATGAISWSLSPAVGSLSATAGTSVSYTPPATLAAQTVVTLTASAAGVSDASAITVNPATAGAGVVVDHTAADAAGIPVAWLDAARALDVLFGHQSIGNDITDGLHTMSTQTPARYGLVIGGEYWPPLWGTPSPSWFGANDGLGGIYVGTNGNPASKTTAFDRAVRGGYGAAVDVALMKFCFTDVYGASSGLEVWNLYRTTMLGLMSAYPGVRFVWTTMPLAFIGSASDQGYGAISDDFNARVRAHVASNGGYLLDVADLETHSASGTPTFSAEGHSNLSTSWNAGAGDAHLNPAGKLRMANAWWVLMARIAGWAP